MLPAISRSPISVSLLLSSTAISARSPTITTAYSGARSFPSSSYHNSNYFRDIVFLPDLVATISKVSGDKQSGSAGTTLPNPLVVWFAIPITTRRRTSR